MNLLSDFSIAFILQYYTFFSQRTAQNLPVVVTSSDTQDYDPIGDCFKGYSCAREVSRLTKANKIIPLLTGTKQR